MDKPRAKKESMVMKNTALPACSGDPLVDHAVTIMDLTTFSSKVSRKMLSKVLFEVCKHGEIIGRLDQFAKQLGINSNYMQIAFVVLQEFGLVVRKSKGGVRYHVDFDRLRDPVSKPIQSVRRRRYDGDNLPGDSGSTIQKTAKPEKIAPRTRCVECGAKVTVFSDKVKHVCMACNLRR